MEINVLDKDYNLIAIVEDFISLMWCKRYYDVGALDLEIVANKKNVEIFKVGYFIARNDDDTIYRIEAIEIDDKESDSLIIGAVDCKSILGQRIIWEKVVFNGSVEDYIRLLINTNVIAPKLQIRKIDNFLLTDKKGFSDEISQQVSYKNLGEKIIEICKTYKYGSRVFLKDKKFYFDLYKGLDTNLFFSKELDNLLSSKYNYDHSEFRNCALIAGEGEGDNRTKTNVGEPVGLERFELFIDDSESKDDLSDMEYLNKLKSKGYEELAKTSIKTKIEGEVDINFYKYKKDYNLGDVVTIKNEYGISTKARITEIIETWDKDGYSLEPRFDYDEFEIVNTTIELSPVLISTYTTNMSNEITFNKLDYPYGLTIEILGGKGKDGGGGNHDSYIEGFTRYSGAGGAGGAGGEDVNFNFSVDNIDFYAIALGGGGGGGGCGLYQDDGKTSYGGKGGFGEGIILNLTFENSVTIKNIAFVASLANGEQPQRHESYIRELIYSYGLGGKSAMGDETVQESPTEVSNGADCVTLRTGATTNYLNFALLNSTNENNHIVKVYKWEKVN